MGRDHGKGKPRQTHGNSDVGGRSPQHPRSFRWNSRDLAIGVTNLARNPHFTPEAPFGMPAGMDG
eukprot:12689898-Alexandrium_andersonii.AAC.1